MNTIESYLKRDARTLPRYLVGTCTIRHANADGVQKVQISHFFQLHYKLLGIYLMSCFPIGWIWIEDQSNKSWGFM